MTAARSQGGPTTVWIDMLNSPHVLFFRPLIDELHQRGYGTYLTIRDFAQTRGMCELYGVRHVVMGMHGGASLVGKAANLANRTAQLVDYARRVKPDLVLTHNSYSQLVAARILGIPSVTSMDYEYQPANHLAFRCADAVFVPHAFEAGALRRCGARPGKVWRYPGIKEEISLAGFSASAEFRRLMGAAEDRVLVVVRPPARFALYHRFENPLFDAVLKHVLAPPDSVVVILPRTPEQAEQLAAAGLGANVWQGRTLDGPSLIAAADLVVSAGGSMVREAAVLGTPAYSVYAGRLGGVDQQLEREGRLAVVRHADDLARLRVAKKPAGRTVTVSGDMVRQFVDHAEETWSTCSRGGRT